MPEIERLDSDIAWIDVLFVERQRTPGWAIQAGIRSTLGQLNRGSKRSPSTTIHAKINTTQAIGWQSREQ